MRGSRIRSQNIAQVVAPRSLNSSSFDAEQVASFDAGASSADPGPAKQRLQFLFR
jgi:hypothetical protein